MVEVTGFEQAQNNNQAAVETRKNGAKTAISNKMAKRLTLALTLVFPNKILQRLFLKVKRKSEMLLIAAALRRTVFHLLSDICVKARARRCGIFHSSRLTASKI